MHTTDALEALIQALRRLPGWGEVGSPHGLSFAATRPWGAQVLAQALAHAAEQVRHCTRCHTFTQAEVCDTCLDPGRDATRLCVVETPADQSALERTGAFHGLYFVLMGRPSPLDGWVRRTLVQKLRNGPPMAWCRR